MEKKYYKIASSHHMPVGVHLVSNFITVRCPLEWVGQIAGSLPQGGCSFLYGSV
jgi:hypothetical protein